MGVSRVHGGAGLRLPVYRLRLLLLQPDRLTGRCMALLVLRTLVPLWPGRRALTLRRPLMLLVLVRTVGFLRLLTPVRRWRARVPVISHELLLLLLPRWRWRQVALAKLLQDWVLPLEVRAHWCPWATLWARPGRRWRSW